MTDRGWMGSVAEQGERALAVLPAPMRLGPVFWRWRRFIARTERASREAWQSYQANKLRSVLSRARESVPFYRARIPHDPAKYSGQDLFRLLADIPPISRQDLEEGFEDLWSRRVPGWRRRVVTTGGTTGAPFAFGLERGSSVAEWAFISRIWERIGFRLGDRRLMVRGLALRGAVLGERPLLDELQLSAFHLSEAHLRPVWPRVAQFAPRFVHGYPSALLALVMWDADEVRRLPLKGLLCGSEALLPWQRAHLHAALGRPIIDWYGHSERLVLGGPCAHSPAFHFFPQYGYAECLDPATLEPVEPGERGEIVGTGFISGAMPLIRYRTEDLALLEEPWCRCGRAYVRMSDVRGRWNHEFLIGKTGSPISLAAINFHDRSLEGVGALQFVQEEVGRVILRVQSEHALNRAAISRLGKALRSKFAGEMDVNVVQVSELERAPSGKVRLVLQRTGIGQSFSRDLLGHAEEDHRQ